MSVNIRQKREQERRRQQILAAAKRVCISKGFARAKVTDVAAEAELSVGTIYIYFRNKDELFAALSIRVLKHLNVSLWRTKESRDLNLDQSLELVKKALLEVHEIDPHMFLTLSNLQAGETLANITLDLHRKIIDLLNQSFEIISHIFAEAFKAGPSPAATPTKLALILWALFSGLVLWEESKRSLNPRKNFFAPTLDVAFEIFARGLGGLSGQRLCHRVAPRNELTTRK
ncbi:MAG: TetR/AcrR family transcriptional regulator [Desulfobacterales bacterium]